VEGKKAASKIKRWKVADQNEKTSTVAGFLLRTAKKYQKGFLMLS